MVKNKSFNFLLNTLSKSSNIRDFLFTYYGNLNQDLIISIINMLESKMLNDNLTKTIISKAKIISVEILQNILKHQTIHSTLFPYFVVGKNKEKIIFYSGNIVCNKDKIKLLINLENLKKIKTDEMRNNYIFALRNSNLSLEGNAGIGLLDIIFRSGNKIEYRFDDINKQLSTFNLKVLLN